MHPSASKFQLVALALMPLFASTMSSNDTSSLPVENSTYPITTPTPSTSATPRSPTVQLLSPDCASGCQCNRLDLHPPEAIRAGKRRGGGGTAHQLHRWHQVMAKNRLRNSMLHDEDHETTSRYHDDQVVDELFTGRMMTCNSLFSLPDHLPTDVSKLIIYGQRPTVNGHQRDSPAPSVPQSQRLGQALNDDDNDLNENGEYENGFANGNGNGIYPSIGHHVQLTHLDRKLLDAVRQSHVRELTIENNRIKTIAESDLEGLEGLKALRLRNNRVKMVRGRALDGVRNLESLDLSRNHIRSFGKSTFDSISGLRSLDLSRNRISTLSGTTFRRLPALEVLDLSGNRLDAVDEELFRGSVGLRKVILDQNRLEAIPDGLLSAATQLTELSATGNRLMAIPAYAFAGGNFDGSNPIPLERLRLDWNRVASLTRRDLAGFPNMKTLTLTHNNLTGLLEDYTFVDLHRLEKLALDFNEIESLAEQTFRGLTALRELSLSNNRLTELPVATFGRGRHGGLENLERLDLSHNRLESLAEGTFDGLRELRELRLDHNIIRWIEAGGLSPHGGLDQEQYHQYGYPAGRFDDNKLTWIYLSHNMLDRVNGPMLTGLSHAKFIDFSSNRINAIDVTAFQTTQRLASLLFQNNRLKTIEGGTFAGLRYVRHLNFVSNQLTTLDAESFVGLDRVEDITLDDNELVDLPPAEAFNYTSRLLSLSVRRNRLRTADLGLLDFTPRLRRLDLSQNHARTVVFPESLTTSQQKPEVASNRSKAPTKWLRGGLQSLSLSDNFLDTISDKVVRVMRPAVGYLSAGTLRLYGNPWNCDCRLRWLVDSTSRGSAGRVNIVSDDHDEELVCKSPYYLAGRRLQALTIDELQCDENLYEDDQETNSNES